MESPQQFPGNLCCLNWAFEIWKPVNLSRIRLGLIFIHFVPRFETGSLLFCIILPFHGALSRQHFEDFEENAVLNFEEIEKNLIKNFEEVNIYAIFALLE